MTRVIPFLFIVSALLAGGACSLVPKPAALTIHDLGNNNHGLAVSGVAWTVATLDAPTWLWDDRIRYRLRYDDASAVRFYTLDRWQAPVPALLEHKLINAGDQPGFTLHIRLTQFEQEFDTPDTAKVIMKFDAEARALKDHRLVGKKGFKLQRMTASADAQGAIQGFIELSDQAVTNIQAWLGELAVMK